MPISQTSILSEIQSHKPISKRTKAYYRRRLQNRFHRLILAAFREQQKRHGLNQKQLAQRIDKDKSKVNQWLGIPSNLTLETISDLLLGLGVDLDDPSATPIADLVHEADQKTTNENVHFGMMLAPKERPVEINPLNKGLSRLVTPINEELSRMTALMQEPTIQFVASLRADLAAQKAALVQCAALKEMSFGAGAALVTLLPAMRSAGATATLREKMEKTGKGQAARLDDYKQKLLQPAAPGLAESDLQQIGMGS